MTKKQRRPTVCMLARRPCAHLDASIELFEGVLREAGADMVTTTSPAAALAHPGPVLIMLVEQYTIAAHVVAVARAALGRRTAAMVFRAREALTGTKPQTRVKRWLLRIERHLSSVTMMTILPFDLLPANSAALFRSWLHDPQLWDIARLPAPPPERTLAERAREQANGRPIVVALGLMESYKGVEMLAAVASDADFRSQYLLVIAGVQTAAAKPVFDTVKGDSLIENRFISDGELYALYDIADYVWAVYAPSYDQASGIFGRAAQFGKVPIVRAGSLVERYADHLGVPVVSVEWQASPQAVAAAIARSPGRSEPLRLDKEQSTTAILDALFGPDRSQALKPTPPPAAISV